MSPGSFAVPRRKGKAIKPVTSSDGVERRHEPGNTNGGPPLPNSRRDRRRVIRAVATFIVTMGLFYGLVHNPARHWEILTDYHKAIARASGAILSVFGFENTVEGVGIKTVSPPFEVGIVQGCDAIEPTAAFLAAVIASPIQLSAKLIGAIAGTVVLLTINLFRIVSLILIGMYAPSALNVMHEDVWQAAFIVLAIAAWAYWIQWASRRVEASGRASQP